MNKRIVWMSRHAPTKTQLVELERLFPGHDLHFDPAPFSGADDIIRRFRAMEADEMVVVAPWTVIRALTNRGVYPIWAEMEQVPCYKGTHEVVMGNNKKRCYRFVKFHRCTNVNLKLEPLFPQGEKEKTCSLQ